MADNPDPPVLETTRSSGDVFRNTLVAAAAAGVAVLIWRLVDLILLLFACALVAMMFYQFARWLELRLRLPFALALTLAVLVPLASLLTVFTLFGAMLADQFGDLFTRLPAAFASAEKWLLQQPIGQEVITRLKGLAPDGSSIVNAVSGILASTGTALSGLAVVLIGGIYLAAQPRLYTRGILILVPAEHRPRVVHIVGQIVESLNSFLKGQGVGMLFVGVTTSIGLSIVGLPSAVAIGLVGGLCEFVPYLGVIVVTIPAVILGFAQGTDTGIWTCVVLLVVQQVQGNIVSPMVQSRMVDIPPALTIFTLIAAGLLLGPLGVILAVPLTVIGLVLLRELVTHRKA
ncbi:AI-2E family transporter [Sandaracinobacteroides saxicola]|uniref:AI-2E family transporter n=1 Tax=Sandaracinobacteroides saxicola TaxID=2759707 RepID=A0A7G5IH18_9SPHN|nr:AI-2E family transporter [Sandaracinobacteroides saxicola]QMW22660.1 AI-2E family transporter [Sandaracinobacteroides saxicola]